MGPSAPGAAPDTTAAPSALGPLGPNPLNVPSNSSAGQSGPASTATRAAAPVSLARSEARRKTRGAPPGPAALPETWYGPASDGAAPSSSTPRIVHSGAPARDTMRIVPSCTENASNPTDSTGDRAAAGRTSSPSAWRVSVRTGFSSLTSVKRKAPLASFTRASSSRAPAKVSLGASGSAPAADPAPTSR